MTRNYEYKCIDKSILTPVFKKVAIKPLIKLIPKSIPANLITIGANAFVFVALYIAFYQDEIGVWSPLLISFFLLLYLIGDHLDGEQAKRTKTSSALGEFCDHYLDAFNTGLILITFLLIMRIDSWWIWMILISSSYLAHSMIIYEQFKTGILQFEAMGSFEGVLFIAVFIFASYFGPFHIILDMNFFGLKVIELVILISSLGSLMTMLTVYKRVDIEKLNLPLFICSIVWIGIVLAASELKGVTVLVLYCVFHIGKVMFGHLINGKEPVPDLIIPIMLSIFDFSDFGYLMISYLIIRLLLLIRKFCLYLGHEWMWVNPRNLDSSG